jgi:hypothetical protein
VNQFTATVAVWLFTVPQAFVTLTQYDVVPFSLGVVNDALFVPTGVLVSPLQPRYH